MNINSPKLKLISAMLIFSTIGIFREKIPMSSSVIAFIRGVIGVITLLVITGLTRTKISKTDIKNNFLLLVLSGGFIGINWILLFEAYKYAGVAVATICYYMAPVFVILAAPFVLGERLTARKSLCILAAFVGMFFVNDWSDSGEAKFIGILCGIGAALFYASVILMNKKIKNISSYDRTITQLGFAAIVLLPYVLLTEGISVSGLNVNTVVLLLIVGVVHTGIAYMLYFASIKDLNAKTVALFGYIDPAAAIILSVLILGQELSISAIFGAVLILGAAILGELPERGTK